MNLSVERINRKSPYWVIQLDDLTFRFNTKNGISYRVGFYQDKYFLGEKAYHFFITNENEIFAPKDNNVFSVITIVLEEFFRSDKSVMLYICDPQDHREQTRANLYQRWFSIYPRRRKMTLKTVELTFDDYIVYAGMILRNDNPEYNERIDDFNEFVKRANKIYSVDDKP